MDLFDFDEGEFQWLAPLSPLHALESHAASTASSQETAGPTEQSPPTTCSSPQELLVNSTPNIGENLEELGPIATGRVQAKCFLLTWSQAPQLSKETIKSHLETLGDLESLAVGQEAHADGGIHFHACTIFREKIRLSPKAFALLGAHPNVRTANGKRGPLDKCMVNYWNYVQKEDTNPLLMGPGPQAAKRTRNEIYLQAAEIAATTSVDAALDYVRLNAAADYVTKLDSISRSLTSHRNKKTRHLVPARTLSEFRAHPDIPDVWRVLFLWGKSGAGKTQYAKALLPEASIVRHRNQLADCDFSKGVIFDDFDVSHWPPTAVIHLLDWDEVTGTDIKHGYVVIPPHTQKIFTFNRRPDAWCPPNISEEQFQAVLRRMNSIEIQSNLF